MIAAAHERVYDAPGFGGRLHLAFPSPERPRESTYHFEASIMSQPSDVRATSTPMAPPFPGDFLLRVCTNNPFYVLSAGLFLFGLRVSYGGKVEAVHTWSLMGGLAGYTLLLAGTAS